MKGLIVLIAVFTLTAAMVPMKRAVNTEEEEERLRSQSKIFTTTQKSKTEICAMQTPCAWSTYKTSSKIVEMNITNSYCICGPGKSCQIYEDDTTVKAYVLRCMPYEEEGAPIS